MRPGALRRIACGVLLAFAAVGCARTARPKLKSTVTQLVTPAEAEATVQAYFQDMDAGKYTAAASLWSAAWRASHPVAGWTSNPPLPPGVQPQFAGYIAKADSVTLAVRAVASGPLGVRWGTGQFTVAAVHGAPILTGGAIGPSATPEDLQALARNDSAGNQTGDATCGTYQVRWSMRPGAAGGGGALSAVSVTAADGTALNLPAMAGFSFGTVPTFCGDFLGNGGEELMLTMATTSAHYYRQSFVYALGRTRAHLIGQVPSVEDARYPRPVAEDGLMPYAIVGMRQIDDVGSGPILAPVIWAVAGGVYQRETAAFPDVLREDLASRLAGAAGWSHCVQPFAACAGRSLLLAYYDFENLGEASKGLSQLQGLVPPTERAWVAQQAGIVEMNVARP